jgi:hypothetical protein
MVFLTLGQTPTLQGGQGFLGGLARGIDKMAEPEISSKMLAGRESGLILHKIWYRTYLRAHTSPSL